VNENNPSIEDIKFLHERAWNRIIWYRSEMWKISISLYTGLVGFIAVAIQFSKEIPNEHKIQFAIVYAMIGSFLIYSYGLYLNSLGNAAKNCNAILEAREKYLCEKLYLNEVNGFRTKEEHPDTSYQYLKKQKPGLVKLKLYFAVFLLFLGVVCVCFL
jgi:hypothetical protein